MEKQYFRVRVELMDGFRYFTHEEGITARDELVAVASIMATLVQRGTRFGRIVSVQVKADDV